MDDLMYGLGMLNNSLINAANIAIASDTKSDDRAFSRSMYREQLADNRENWRMMNEYNSPSAQMERLHAAGLNPNLIYGSGAVANAGSLPSGANYNAGYSQAPRMDKLNMLGEYLQLRQYQKNLELTDAQIAKLNSETLNTESATRGREIENKYQYDTFELRKALLQGNLNQIVAYTNKLAQDMRNSIAITEEQVLTMAQARLYEVKRYNLSEKEVGARIKQGWANVANGRLQASAALQNAATNALRTVKLNELTDQQIGAMAIDMWNNRIRGRGFELDNRSKDLDFFMKASGIGFGKITDELFGATTAAGFNSYPISLNPNDSVDYNFYRPQQPNGKTIGVAPGGFPPMILK